VNVVAAYVMRDSPESERLQVTHTQTDSRHTHTSTPQDGINMDDDAIRTAIQHYGGATMSRRLKIRSLLKRAL